MSEALFTAKEINVEEFLQKVEGLPLRGKAELFRGIKAKRSVVSDYDKSLKKIEDSLATMMGEELAATGTKRATFEGVGTVYTKTDIKVSVEDIDKFYEFVFEEAVKSKEEFDTPTAGFTYLTKSPSQRQVKEMLEERAKQSLEESPYGAGSLEYGMSYDEQLLARTKEEASALGLKIYEDVKTSVIKN